MKKKKKMGVPQPSLLKKEINDPKRSILDLYKKAGIPAENTTHFHLGETKLIFSNVSSIPIEDDSFEASIRNLKYSRFKK